MNKSAAIWDEELKCFVYQGEYKGWPDKAEADMTHDEWATAKLEEAKRKRKVGADGTS